jgi:L-lactate dehydrogenase (cytochrome)
MRSLSATTAGASWTTHNRNGQDILRARALGAQAVYIGRPFLYGLGAYGKAGVTKALEILYKEADTSMALCGQRDIANVDARILLNPANPFAV